MYVLPSLRNAEIEMLGGVMFILLSKLPLLTVIDAQKVLNGLALIQLI